MSGSSRQSHVGSVRLASAVLLGSLGLLAVFLQQRWGGDAVVVAVDDLSQAAFAWVAAGFCFVTWRRSTSARRRSWAALTAALTSWGSGGLIWAYYELVANQETPFPSLADVGYLLFVPAAMVALWCYPGAGRGTRARTQLALDGAIAAASLLVLTWVTTLGAVFEAGGSNIFAFSVSLAYPVADLGLLTVAILVLARSTARRRLPLILLSAGMAAMALADSAFAYLTATGAYRSGALTDLAWPAAFALLSIGGMVDRGPDERQAEAELPSRLRMYLPYVAIPVAAAIVVRQLLIGSPISAVERVALVAIVVLIFVRQLITLGENSHLVSELAIARDQALDASRMKSAFLANISHEIRTPMNGVLGMTELLLADNLTQRQTERAELIHTSGDVLLSLIDQILDFSKIEAGKLELDKTEYDLPELVSGVCDLLSLQAHSKRLELPLLIEDGVPTLVSGDAGRLRQVLTNLIGNAVKFTDAGEVAVVVRRGSEPEEIQFSVTDTGPGIELDQRTALFEPFSQVDASTTRRFGGSGLGLSISRQLVRLMGGDIAIVSTPGSGSTFSFAVTLDAVTVNAASTVGAPGDGAPPVAPSGVRIMVVDDNATTRDIVSGHLASGYADVSFAKDGREAIRALNQASDDGAPFEVIIVDDTMPGMSGSEVARVVRGTPPLDTAGLVILCSPGSSSPAPRAVERCIQINKPLRRERLYEAIEQVAASRSISIAVPAQARRRTGHRAAARILLTEDNRINQLVATQMLTKLGHTVEVAENGREALEALEANRYDLVFMDCHMPEMDGYAAATELRRREAKQALGHIPVVAMTANTMRGARDNCLAAGMDDYLSKPFRMQQLNDILDRWIPETAEPIGSAV